MLNCVAVPAAFTTLRKTSWSVPAVQTRSNATTCRPVESVAIAGFCKASCPAPALKSATAIGDKTPPAAETGT